MRERERMTGVLGMRQLYDDIGEVIWVISKEAMNRMPGSLYSTPKTIRPPKILKPGG